MQPGAVGETPEYLLVGLGNPGPRYARSRHNIGFVVAELLARRWGAGPWRASCHSLVAPATFGDNSIWLARPHTYMNRSGVALRELVRQSRVEIGRIMVVHDDLDLPLGRLRIRLRGGHGGHNGMRSVLEVLGAEPFVRLKLGIGRPAEQISVVDHVLASFTPQEEAVLSGLLERAAEAVESVIVEGPVRAMNLFPS